MPVNPDRLQAAVEHLSESDLKTLCEAGEAARKRRKSREDADFQHKKKTKTTLWKH